MANEERRIGQRRRIRTGGGRRKTDSQVLPAIASPGAALPDRVAYLEGSILAAWEALDNHFQRFREVRGELKGVQERLRQLADTVDALGAASRTKPDDR